MYTSSASWSYCGRSVPIGVRCTTERAQAATHTKLQVKNVWRNETSTPLLSLPRKKRRENSTTPKRKGRKQHNPKGRGESLYPNKDYVPPSVGGWCGCFHLPLAAVAFLPPFFCSPTIFSTPNRSVTRNGHSAGAFDSTGAEEGRSPKLLKRKSTAHPKRWEHPRALTPISILPAHSDNAL